MARFEFSRTLEGDFASFFILSASAYDFQRERVGGSVVVVRWRALSFLGNLIVILSFLF